MTLTQINSFLAVAREHSFTEAARSLFFSQQAVSKYIKELESELGVTLFNRSKSGVSPTEAGAFYARFFAAQLEAGSLLVKEIATQDDRWRTTFRIGYSVWINPFCEVDGWISTFRERHPVTLFVGEQHHNETLVKKLTDGSLDVALISGAQYFPDPSFECAEIAPEDICLCVREHLAGDEIDPACWGLPLVQVSSWDWDPLAWRYIDTIELESIDIRPPSVKLLPNIQSMLMELAFGKSVAVLDRRFGFANTLRSIRSFPIELHSYSHLCCIWKKSADNPDRKSVV